MAETTHHIQCDCDTPRRSWDIGGDCPRAFYAQIYAPFFDKAKAIVAVVGQAGLARNAGLVPRVYARLAAACIKQLSGGTGTSLAPCYLQRGSESARSSHVGSKGGLPLTLVNVQLLWKF